MDPQVNQSSQTDSSGVSFGSPEVVVPPSSPSTPAVPIPPELPKQSLFLVKLAQVLLGVSILAIIAYFVGTFVTAKKVTLTPTPSVLPSPATIPDPIANWEVYINTQNNYSIKYPKSFLSLICPNEELTLTNRSVDEVRPGPIEMSTCARGGRYTLETKTYPSPQPAPQETKYYKIEERTITLGGVPAKQYTYTFTNVEVGPFPVWYTIARVNKNNKTYEVYFDDNDSLILFDQILSTFGFLEASSTPLVSPSASPQI